MNNKLYIGEKGELKIMKQDFQIMSFKHKYGNLYTRRKDGSFTLTVDSIYSEEYLKTQQDTIIYSVKYLPSNEIFTIDDEVMTNDNKFIRYKIKSFCIFIAVNELMCSAKGDNIDLNLSVISVINLEVPIKEENMNKEVRIPQKWVIRGCPELKNYEKTTLNGNCSCGLYYDSYYYYNSTSNLGLKDWNYFSSYNLIPSDFEEITFEFFEKYILNQEKMEKGFEIKVVNSSLKTYWYASYIGETFKVKKSDSSIFDYEVIEGKHKGDHLLAKDCLLNNKKLKGYKLIKEYPGSKGLGYFQKYTTGKLSKYPEFWEPVYEKEIKIVKLNIGEFVVEIHEDKIYITGNGVSNFNISHKFLTDVLEDMEENNFPDSPKAYKVIFPFVKIGCSTFSIEDIKLVLKEYNKLNELGS